MKANAPKRKVFHDAVDLLTGEMETAKASAENSILQIPVDDIRPFPDHPFHLYEGDRLEEMVQSVKDHGILVPVIVRKTGDGSYEMLAGHNRQQAARLAGLQTIPAIVKEGLTEEEALVYVIETNMLQRSFSELSISEKAAVLAERYDRVISQGRRNDILRELEELNDSNTSSDKAENCQNSTCGQLDHKLDDRSGDTNPDPQGQDSEQRQDVDQGQGDEQRQDSEQSRYGTCGQVDHKLNDRSGEGQEATDAEEGSSFDTRSREMLGVEHGISGSSVKRLLRVNRLIPALKEQADSGRLSLEAAVQLSYASEEIQGIAAGADRPVRRETAAQLRREGLTAEDARKILQGVGKVKSHHTGKNIRIAGEVYDRYFHNVKSAEAARIVEAALAAWFADKEESPCLQKSR